jgi:hypothetical protein
MTSNIKTLLALSFLLVILTTGCKSVSGHFAKTNPDGTSVNFDGSITSFTYPPFFESGVKK